MTDVAGLVERFWGISPGELESLDDACRGLAALGVGTASAH